MAVDNEDAEVEELSEEDREVLLNRLDSVDDEESHMSTAEVFEELGIEEHL